MKKQISIQSFDASKMYNKDIIIENLKEEINKSIEQTNDNFLVLELIENNDFKDNNQKMELLKDEIYDSIKKAFYQMENKRQIEYLAKEKEIQFICKQTKIPIIDINGKYISINPFELISIINNFDYPDTVCLRSESKDIFIHLSYNKVFTSFIESLQSSNFNDCFSKNKPWTIVPPFPNSYNRYKLDLKCITFDLAIYRFVHQFENLNVNPKDELKKLGVIYQLSTQKGVSTVFWNCQNIPKDLPEYFIVSDDSPNTQNCLFPLTQEIANQINNYML